MSYSAYWAPATRAKQNRAAIRRPTLNLGAARSGVISEALRRAAISWHHVNIGTAFVLPTKSDPFAVRRKMRVIFRAGIRCDPLGRMIADRGKPQIALGRVRHHRSEERRVGKECKYQAGAKDT